MNQLVRVHPDLVDELLDATTALDEAQRATLSGERRNMKALSERRQAAMEDLLTRANQIIEANGRSSAGHSDDILRTLQATGDPEAARLFREGHLTTSLEPTSNLDGLTAWFDQSGAATASTERAQRRSLRQAVEQAAEDLTATEQDLRGAQAEADRLQREARAAAKRVEKLTGQRDQRQRALDDAERARTDAEQ
jgi:hypothetical protein